MRLFLLLLILGVLSLNFGNGRGQDEVATATESGEDDFETTTGHSEDAADESESQLPITSVEMLDGDLDVGTAYASCTCGKSGRADSVIAKKTLEGIDFEPLVIGGEQTAVNEFPWMVAITKRKSYDRNGPAKVVCGGSFLNNKFVVTAAHCIHKEFTFRYELLARAHNTTNVQADPTVIKLKAKRFISHPGWDSKTVANDIGLIELETPIDFSKTDIGPVCLPSKADGDFAEQNATVIGWGYTRPKGSMATILQKVILPVISHEKCTQTRYGNIVTPSMLCAGYPEGQKDACTNDSGGPLTVVQGGVHKLIGIVSWGHGCAQPSAPGVFTRVTKYLGWIDSVIGRTKSCKA